jgi:hypothetical protein
MTFGAREIPEDFDINHGPDATKSNNCIENLTPVSKAEHVGITRNDNPEMVGKRALSLARLVMLKWTAREDMREHVGKTVTTRAFATLLASHDASNDELSNITNKVSANAWLNKKKLESKKEPKNKTEGCIFVNVADKLLNGEEDKEGSILIDGEKHSFTVTSFGRYKCPKGHKYVETPYIQLAGKNHSIYFLVMLAYSGLSARPERDGKKLTVDHINGRDMPFPHRIENLRWATCAEQMANRAVQAESLED